MGLSREGLPIGLQAIGPYLEDRTPIRFATLLAKEIGAPASGREVAMRGDDRPQAAMFSYRSPEQRVRRDHPLGPIRAMVDGILRGLSPKFDMLSMMYHVFTPVGGDQP